MCKLICVLIAPATLMSGVGSSDAGLLVCTGVWAAELHRAHSLYALAPPKPLIGARPAFPLISQECLCECVQQTAPAQACSGRVGAAGGPSAFSAV